MPNRTPFFKAFGPLLFGRPARRAIEKLQRFDSLQELYELFGHLFPERLLEPSAQGANSRERTFTAQVTFWAFVAQILSPGSSCREMVRRVDAWWQRATEDGVKLSGSTSAYCQARARLDPAALELISGEKQDQNPVVRKQAEDRERELKAQLEQTTALEGQLRARESEAASQLRIEQGKLDALEARLDAIEKQLNPVGQR